MYIFILSRCDTLLIEGKLLGLILLIKVLTSVKSQWNTETVIEVIMDILYSLTKKFLDK